MALNFTWIKYWKVIAGTIITGTTIFVINDTRHLVEQVDIIEIAEGVSERCYATQYSTNPLFRVNPPNIVKTWVTSNGNEVVTNAIGNFTDINLMNSLDVKTKALVPYYGWSNSPGENMTVTGLWASLGIGDGTNQFTRVPCWTNDAQVVYPINFTNYYPHTNAPTTNSFTSLYPETVRYAYGFWSNGYYWTNRLFSASNVITTTNLATYGNYAQQIYVVALQERYKVLNAMRYMIDENKDVVDKSSWSGGKWTGEVWKYGYSNKVTGVSPEYGHGPDVQAYLSGLTEDYYYSSYPYSTNYTPLYGCPDYNTNFVFHWNPTWAEAKANSEWDWYYTYWYYMENGSWVRMYDPPYRVYTNEHDSTEYTGWLNYVGETCTSYKKIRSYSFDDPTYPYHEYLLSLTRAYGTVRWANYQYTNIPSTMSVYYKGATNLMDESMYQTEIVTNDWWRFPRQWTVDQTWSFEEDITPSVNYQKLNDSYISQSNAYSQVVFGSDQFPKLVYAGSIPPWGAEPSGGTAWNNNEGSVFTEKGLKLDYVNIKGVRNFQFSYCTNRFW